MVGNTVTDISSKYCFSAVATPTLVHYLEVNANGFTSEGTNVIVR